MKNIKVLVFKDTGKYYTTEEVQVPAGITEIFEVVDYMEKNYKEYPGMHLVMLLEEYDNGYPCMIPAERRV